jgi:hypothetical protein
MEIQITQAHTAILFAILFIVGGWIAPAAYGAYAPQDRYITVNEFQAENTTLDAERHTICFDRTIRKEQTGVVLTELYLISNNSKTIRLDSRTTQRYFIGGEKAVQTTFELPQNLVTGTYKYLLVVKMEVAKGRVDREFSFESEPFTVTKNATETNNGSFVCG